MMSKLNEPENEARRHLLGDYAWMASNYPHI